MISSATRRRCTNIYRGHRENLTMDHYDLLGRPGWKATSVLVVSPYVESTFFERIVRDLRPATLTVGIDEGCRADDGQMVRSLARVGKTVHVGLARPRGHFPAQTFPAQ